MWKTVFAAMTAFAIAGSTLTYAQQPAERDARSDRQPITPEDRAAFLDARIAGLKAGLGLTVDQEKNWGAFEQTIRDLAKSRFDRMEARRTAAPSSDPIERLRRRADAMTQTAAVLKKLADTGAPLYQSLDDAQKRRFVMLAYHVLPRMGWHRSEYRRSDREHDSDRSPDDRGHDSDRSRDDREDDIDR